MDNLTQMKPSSHQIVKSLLFLVTVVTLGFVIVYRRWLPEAWLYPIDYKADHLFVHFFTNLYAQTELIPYFSKNVAFMNAPLGANFDDLPGNEDLVYWVIGLAERVFGQFRGQNIALWATLIGNAISFYLFLLYFGIRNCLATAGGTAIGLSHFFLLRGIEHIILTAAWHVPPMLIIVYWFFQADTVWTQRKN